MLMTKSIFAILQDQDGHLHVVVERFADGAQKYFFQASGSVEGMTKFMESMTDELVDGYFPKPGKRGGSPADNWAFIGPNPARASTEKLAREMACAFLAGEV